MHQLVDTHVIHLKLMCSLKRFRTRPPFVVIDLHTCIGALIVKYIRCERKIHEGDCRRTNRHSHIHNSTRDGFPCIHWPRSTECMGYNEQECIRDRERASEHERATFMRKFASNRRYKVSLHTRTVVILCVLIKAIGYTFNTKGTKRR